MKINAIEFESWVVSEIAKIQEQYLQETLTTAYLPMNQQITFIAPNSMMEGTLLQMVSLYAMHDCKPEDLEIEYAVDLNFLKKQAKKCKK